MPHDILQPFAYRITPTDRAALMGHSPALVWFTGLSAAGKSTLADCLAFKLHRFGIHTAVLDGDTIRCGLNRDLDFTAKGRSENIRRVTEVSQILLDAGLLVIAAFVSPYRKDRDAVRKKISPLPFVEVYVKTPITICETRDPKGLYNRARLGKIGEFTGINAEYEEPLEADIVIPTTQEKPEEASQRIIQHLQARAIL
ncbi:MAG: adenylyl-sulfate kinase [Bacteroidia bacterium]|jgi:adenylyl-sulfate kinase